MVSTPVDNFQKPLQNEFQSYKIKLKIEWNECRIVNTVSWRLFATFKIIFVLWLIVSFVSPTMFCSFTEMNICCYLIQRGKTCPTLNKATTDGATQHSQEWQECLRVEVALLRWTNVEKGRISCMRRINCKTAKLSTSSTATGAIGTCTHTIHLPAHNNALLV